MLLSDSEQSGIWLVALMMFDVGLRAAQLVARRIFLGRDVIMQSQLQTIRRSFCIILHHPSSRGRLRILSKPYFLGHFV